MPLVCDQWFLTEQEYKPDAVAVSAGFDGYKDDSLLDLNLSVNAYYETGKLLSHHFKNIFACLEGGYSIKLPECVNAFISGVNNEELRCREERTMSSIETRAEFEARMKKLKKNISPVWKF